MRGSVVRTARQIAGLLFGVFVAANVCAGSPENEIDTRPYSAQVSESSRQFVEKVVAVASEATFAAVPARFEGAFAITFRKRVIPGMTFFEAVKSRERDLSVTMTQSAAKPGGYAVIGTSMRVLSFAKDDGACLSPKELGAHLEAAGWKNTSSTVHSMNVPITYSWGNEHARLSTTPLVVNGAFCLELINILYTH